MWAGREGSEWAERPERAAPESGDPPTPMPRPPTNPEAPRQASNQPLPPTVGKRAERYNTAKARAEEAPSLHGRGKCQLFLLLALVISWELKPLW